ncbi:hypothetical protein G5V59_20315 [Nocardioides sp. W3-2-3]|uniref:hypothetical protein n=1 Tax=Nocardioides convexus TaxID=2712224 RepID=UPI0024181A35|nr:hypothetical protein [Nocardioides convexus]NHA01393.1 hypothetical protein [Nocardioides convexus]
MKQTTSPETQTGRHLESVDTHRVEAVEDAAARAIARRAALRDRHAQNLTRLMEQRSDLRGVHPLADFVDDAVRWSA